MELFISCLAAVMLVSELQKPVVYDIYGHDIESCNEFIAEMYDNYNWQYETDDVTVGVLYNAVDLMNTLTMDELYALSESPDVHKFDKYSIEVVKLLYGEDTELGEYFLDNIGATEINYENVVDISVLNYGEEVSYVLEPCIMETVAGVRLENFIDGETMTTFTVMYKSDENFEYLCGFLYELGYEVVEVKDV